MDSVIKRWGQRIWNEPPKESWQRFQVRVGLKKNTEFDQHIWCLSTGRVGTKTLATLLNLVPQIKSEHEPSPKLFGISKVAHQHSDHELKSEILEAVHTCRFNLKGLSQNIYLESSPHLTFTARYLNKLFPNSKFIHLVRNPVAVVESGLKRKWYNGNTIDNWRIVPKPDAEVLNEWNHWNAFEKNVWSWTETNNWIDSFFKELSTDSKLILKSEDLFSGKESALNDLFKFCGGTKPTKANVEKILKQKINASTNKVETKTYSFDNQKLERLKEIAGPAIQKFGYDI